jgi:hypothetical protein
MSGPETHTPGRVPEAWTQLIAVHRQAQVAQDQMRNPQATQVMRDEATGRYTVAVDAIMACLDRLSERNVLGAVTLYLAGKEKRI